MKTYQPTADELRDARTEAVIYAEGTPVTAEGLVRRWRDACDEAGEYISPQDVYAKAIAFATMTLEEFCDLRGTLKYIHVASQTWPSGEDLAATDDGGDIDEGIADTLCRWGQLTGAIDNYGRWQWDGRGRAANDPFGGTLFSLTCR